MPPKRRGGGKSPAKAKATPPVVEKMETTPVESKEKEVKPEPVKEEIVNQEPPLEKVEANGNGDIKDDGEVKEEEEDEEEDNAEKTVDDDEAKEEEKSLIVKLKGFPRMDAWDMHLMLYEIFKNELKIELPKVKLPKGKEKWIYAECASLEDKKKIIETLNASYKYKNIHPLQATSGWVTSEYKATEILDKETALDILFKNRNIPYKDQLTLKSNEAEKMMKDIFDNLKKTNHNFPKSIRCPDMGKIVPMVPLYGYSLDSTFAIEMDPETKEILVGLRATSKKAERIVPIDECPNIPKNMSDAVKDLVAHLGDYGLEPFNREAETGNILGVQCKMSTSCEIILSILVPKENTFLKEFMPIKTPEEVAVLKEEAKQKEEAKKQAEELNKSEATKAKQTKDEKPEEKPEEKVEDKENKDEVKDETVKTDESVTLVELDDEDVKATDEEKAKYGRQLKEIKPGLLKYFEERGKPLGIVSIYSNWILYNRRGAWANRQHFYHHVCGATSVKELTLNLQYDLWPYKQWSPRTSIFGTIINTIDSLVHLDKSTSVAVASEYRLVALYFAKRCKDVLSINFWSGMKKSGMQNRAGFSWWIQKQGVRNMEFIATKTSALSTLERTKFARSQGPKVAVIWGFSKVTLLRKLHNMGVKRIVAIFNINRNMQSIQADIQKYFEAISPAMAATKIIPVDVQPHGNQYTLVCFLEEIASSHQIGQKRKRAEPVSVGGKRKRPLPLVNDGHKKAWDSPRPHMPPHNPPVDPINSTITQLTGFMQSQLLFNEMMKAGMQEMLPHREQPRPPVSPPRFAQRNSWGGRSRDDESYDDFRGSDNFNGRDASTSRWSNKRDDFARSRPVPPKPLKDAVWGSPNESGGIFSGGNKSSNWLNTLKQPNYNRNDSREDFSFNRQNDNRRPRGNNSRGNYF